MQNTHRDRLLRLALKNGIVRARDLGLKGIPRIALTRAVSSRELKRVGRGIYSSTKSHASENTFLAELAIKSPQGVVCLLSALRFHEITTQAPFEIWWAIPNKARAPRMQFPPIRIVRMSQGSLAAGIEAHRIDGATVHVFNVPKTVADCFKYRGKIGLDVALEALREAMGSRRASADDIWRYAKICRVANVMRPYMESIA